jgi:dolichol-phosphate mannosyltransferase
LPDDDHGVTLSVVIPARNEAGNIGKTLDELTDRLTRERLSYELIVVDDGSSDQTVEEVAARGERDPAIRLVTNEGPHGYGHAVRRGLGVFRGAAVAIVMADGSDDPEDLIHYYEILRDRAECAFGSRFVHGSNIEGYPRLKLVINRAANLFIRVLFGIPYNDVTNAFKAYRASVIQGCRPFLSPHYNLTVELPLKTIIRGYSYEVVPIAWRERSVGRSSFHLREMGSRYLFIVLYLWLEKLLTRGDYRRPAGEGFVPWPKSTVVSEKGHSDGQS